MFVIISPDGGPVYVQSLEKVDLALLSLLPGRYDIDEVTIDPLTSKCALRRWGIGIKRNDGAVALEPGPAG